VSFRYLNAAWKADARIKDGKRLVLLALADSADDSGQCWAFASTIATKCQMDERNVRRCLKELISLGAISVTEGGPGRSRKTAYQLHVDAFIKPDNLSPFTEDEIPDNLSPNEEKPDNLSDKTGQSVPFSGDKTGQFVQENRTFDAKTARYIRKDPLKAPIPTTGAAAAAEGEFANLKKPVQYGDVFRAYENVMPGSLTAAISDKLNDLIDTYGADEVLYAIDQAAEYNGRNIKYIRSICERRAAGGGEAKGGSTPQPASTTPPAPTVLPYIVTDSGEYQYVGEIK